MATKDVRVARTAAARLDAEMLAKLRAQATTATDLTKLRAALVALLVHLEGTT